MYPLYIFKDSANMNEPNNKEIHFISKYKLSLNVKSPKSGYVYKCIYTCIAGCASFNTKRKKKDIFFYMNPY